MKLPITLPYKYSFPTIFPVQQRKESTSRGSHASKHDLTPNHLHPPHHTRTPNAHAICRNKYTTRGFWALGNTTSQPPSTLPLLPTPILEFHMPKLPLLIDKWHELISVNRKPSTVNSYIYSVKRYSQGVEDIDDLTRAHLEDYLLELTREFKPNTVLKHIAAIKQFLRWLMGRDDLDFQISLENLPIPEAEIPEMPVLTKKQVEELFASVPYLRDQLIFRLGYDFALRIGEVLSLRRKDYSNGKLTVNILKSRTPKITTFTVLPATRLMLNHYISKTKPQPDDRLFSLTRQAVNLRLRKYATELNLTTPESDFGFHNFKRARLTHAHQAGMSPLMLQQLGHHTRFTTTQRYIHIEPKELDAELLRLEGV